MFLNFILINIKIIWVFQVAVAGQRINSGVFRLRTRRGQDCICFLRALS